MKKYIIASSIISLLFVSASAALADTLVVATNGAGTASATSISFSETYADGVTANRISSVTISGSVVSVRYFDGTFASFPYAGTLSSGAWQGIDEWGFSYTASVSENYLKVAHTVSCGGRAFRRCTVYSYVLTGGQVTYDYPTSPIPPAPAPLTTTLSCNTNNTQTVSWTADPNAASYSVIVYDSDFGWIDAKDTTSLTATVSSAYQALYIESLDDAGNVIGTGPTEGSSCSGVVAD